jgi:DNA-binding MarR family transcriptional regulator
MNIQLENLGLSKNAVDIYLSLIQYGDSSVGTLSEKTGIQRTNIYPYIKELVEKGLVSWEERRKDSAITVNELSTVLDLAKKQAEKAQENYLSIKGKIATLEAMSAVNSKDFKLEKYVGVEKCRKALETIYSEKELPGGYCGEFVYEQLGIGWYEEHLKKMYVDYKIHDHVLFSEKAFEVTSYSQLKQTTWYDENYAHYKVVKGLELPKGLDVYITEDSVLTIYSAKIPICIIIRNKTYQQYELALFNLLWKSAIDFKDYEKIKS